MDDSLPSILCVDDDVDILDLLKEYFTEQGFTVVHHGPCGLPSNQKLITPEALSDWIRTTVAGHRPDAVRWR